SCPYIFNCQNAQAANQLLLSPYRTMVVLLSIPVLPSNSSSFLIGTMSRTSVSQSSVVQFQPAAPGTCPCSYAVVSTSTSTTRTPVSVACCATQSVFTRTFVSVSVVMCPSSRLKMPILSSYPFREGVVRARGVRIPPGDIRRGGVLEVLQLARVLEGVPHGRHEVADPFPDEQQLAAALIEELGVQHAGGQKRCHHFPIGGHHPVRRVLLAAGRTQRLKLFECLRLERSGKPLA